MPGAIESVYAIFRHEAKKKPRLVDQDIELEELPSDVQDFISEIRTCGTWLINGEYYEIYPSDKLLDCFEKAKNTRHAYMDNFLNVMGSTADKDRIRWLQTVNTYAQ